jgi:hypothetical protein
MHSHSRLRMGLLLGSFLAHGLNETARSLGGESLGSLLRRLFKGRKRFSGSQLPEGVETLKERIRWAGAHLHFHLRAVGQVGIGFQLNHASPNNTT